MMQRNKNKVPIASPNASTIEEEGDTVHLISAGLDHCIKFWTPHDGRCTRTIPHVHSQINDLKITPDKKFLAAASFQHVRMYSIPAIHNTNPEINLEGFNNNVLSIGFQEDSKWLFSGGEDCVTRIWDLKTRKNQSQRMHESGSAVNSVKLHPNQIELFIGQQYGYINVWDIRFSNATPMVRLTQQHPSNFTGVQSLSLNPMEDILAAIDNGGGVHIFSPSRSLTLFRTWKAHLKYGIRCLFSPNGKYLVTTSADCTAKVWRTCDIMEYNPDEQQQALLSPYKVLTDANLKWVWDVAFSADSQFLVTASSDGLVRLWHVETAETTRQFTGHNKTVTSLAFSD